IRIITVIAGLVAAIGPLLLVFSTLLKVFGPLISIFKAVGAGIALIGTKGAIAAAVVGKFAAVAKVITLLMNPWAIGIAAVVAGIVLLVKHLKKDAIPEIDRFGEEVSDSTQEAVGAFMDLNEEANKQLKELSWGQQEVTAEMAQDMKTKQEQITENLLSELNKRQEEEKKLTINQFAELDSISEERKQELIEAQDRFYEEQKTKTQQGHDEINAIITDAEANGRKITEEEAKRIELIREEMVVTAVKTLSESEVEQKAILERMASNSSALSAREAADVVKNSKEKKDAVVDEANKQYVETKEWARQQYEDVGEISEEEYKQVLANAEATRDGKVTNAEEAHNEVVRHAQEQAGEHVDSVDWETGEVMTKWEQMTKNIKEQNQLARDEYKRIWEESKTAISNTVNKIKEKVSTGWSELLENTKKRWEEMKTNTALKWQEMKDNTIRKALELKDGIVLKFTELKDQSIERLNQLKDDAIALPGKIADGIRKGADAVKRAFVEMWNSVVRGISGPVNMVIKGANWILDKFGADQISLWEPTYYGKGTDGHLGGPAIINDQKGSTYREAVMMPDGHTFIPEGRNILFPNMPKGTKVLPARETKGIYNYAGGVGEWFKDKYNTGKEVVGNVMDKAKDIFSYMTDPGKLIGEVLGSFVDLSGTTHIVKDMAVGMIGKVKDSMVEWAKGLFDKYGAVMGGGIGFGGWPITSPFGWRIHPISGERSFHSGVDFGAPYGAAVAAQHAGTVNHSGWMGGYGIAVKIAQGITEQLYAHLSQAIVSVGQSVAQGQIIGNIGSTGNSTGPHLHYEMRRNGSPVDPGFAVGSRYIPRDMVGNLHKGEMVVPKNENPYKNSKGKILPDDKVRQPLVIQVMMEDGRILAENIVDDINQLLGNKNNLSARGLA
ncbi:MAG TPA: peptidoglycan DD-metalloendopeptidase family protein, partial [Atopostipes sp.]|nr:peptidoglycan DD-metalloendopeptidase family protein [Atopostipes sp.]